MDLFAVDDVSGQECHIELNPGSSVGVLKQLCAAALGIDPDVELRFSDTPLTGGDDDLVCNIPDLFSGCRVQVGRGVRRFVDAINSDTALSKIPLWAMRRRECVIAALSGYVFQPHIVTPALWDDKDVMLKAVQKDVRQFFRASPTLRSDKDIAVAALRRDPQFFWMLGEAAQGNRDVVATALTLKVHPRNASQMPNLADLPEPLRGDPLIVHAALGLHGSSELADASQGFLSDKAALIRCFKEVKFWRTPNHRVPAAPPLACIDPALQEDRDIALAARTGCRGSPWLRDKAFVLEALGSRRFVLGIAAEELRADREVVLAALAANSSNLQFASRELRSDRGVVLAAMKRGGSLKHALGDARTDKQVCLARLASHCFNEVELMGPTLRDDRDIALAVMRKNSPHEIFCWFGEAVRNDKEVALLAIQSRPSNFAFAGPDVRADRSVALAAFAQGPVDGTPLLAYTPEALRSDREVVLAAVRADPANAHHASPALVAEVPEILHCSGLRKALPPDDVLLPHQWGDRAAVLSAVRASALPFHQASAALREDKEIALAALNHGVHLFWWLSDALQRDPDIALAVLEGRPDLFNFDCTAPYWENPGLDSFHESLRANISVVRAAVRTDADDLAYASPALRDDKAAMTLLVQDDPNCFEHLSRGLRSDKDVALAALKQGPRDPLCVLCHVGEALRTDAFVREALGQGANAFALASDALRSDREVVMQAVRIDKGNFRQASVAMRSSPEVAALALQRGASLRHVMGAARHNREVCLAAAAQLHNIPFLSGAQLNDPEIACVVARKHPAMFSSLGDVSRDSREIALEAISGSPDAFSYAGPSVRGDRDVALSVFRRTNFSVLLPYASVELQNDAEVVRAAVRANRSNLDYAGEDLKDDPDIRDLE